jgi:hypothetical protein
MIAYNRATMSPPMSWLLGPVPANRLPSKAESILYCSDSTVAAAEDAGEPVIGLGLPLAPLM